MDSDLTLDRLFRASKEVTVAGRQLVVRALGDYELRLQHEEATLASLATQKALADPTSRLYRVRLGGAIETATDQELRDLILFAISQTAQVEATREVMPEFIPLPEGATEAERREVADLRGKSIDKALEARTAIVQRQLEKWTEQIQPLDRTALLPLFTTRAIAIQVDNDFARAYDSAGLLYAVRLPSGNPYFESMAEVDALDDVVRNHLLRELRLVNDLDPLAWSGTSSTESPPLPGP